MLNEDCLRPDWDLSHVKAFMTTRSGGVSSGPYASMNIARGVGDDPAAVQENRRRVSEALGAKAIFAWQVHGNEVLHLKPEHALSDDGVPKADASISTTPGLGVAILVGDCLPVLFAAPGGVGGAHAGWRGLAAGVLENTVAALCAAANCKPAEIHAWLGACIGPEAFEVGADVLQAFGAEPLPQDSHFFVHRPNAQGEARWRADLAGLARQRLQALGLGSITGGNWCTYTQDSRFFSYRRARLSGRMAACIALR